MAKVSFLKLWACSCLLVFSSMAGYAQTLSAGTGIPPLKPVALVKLDTAHTRVYYRYAYRKDSLNKKLTEGQTVLLVGKNFLGFMDYYQWLFDKLNDSLCYAKAAPVELMAQGMRIMEAVNYSYPLVISRARHRATIQLCNIGTYEYSDSLPAIAWQLIDRDTIISNVPCKEATCCYRGRMWQAWYAPSFPLPVGPYLFGGLPGLIFDIGDTRGNYHFTLNGLENLRAGDDIYLHCSSKIVRTSRANARRAVQNEQRDIQKAFEMASPGLRFPEQMKKGDHSRPYNPIELE